MSQPIENQIAERFTTLIQKCLTPEQLKLVDERNKAYGPSSCATHDFCDANVVMEHAFEINGFVMFEPDNKGDMVMPDRVVELWDKAWDIAKERGFSNVVASA